MITRGRSNRPRRKRVIVKEETMKNIEKHPCVFFLYVIFSQIGEYVFHCFFPMCCLFMVPAQQSLRGPPARVSSQQVPFNCLGGRCFVNRSTSSATAQPQKECTVYNIDSNIVIQTLSIPLYTYLLCLLEQKYSPKLFLPKITMYIAKTD